MGSSIKKKKDKQKDFQKPKLKVGKTRPKASNFTDTSFRSKAITLKEQSLSTVAPSASAQFSHHLSLLGSRSDSQRKDSLGYLATTIATRPAGSALQQPVSVLLPKLLPLVLDGSNGVRNQLLGLLRRLPTDGIGDYAEQLLLYTRAAMTHLAAEIRSSSMDLLGWATDVAGEELVSCAGGWVKTLKCFLAMLAWQSEDTGSSWSSSKVSLGKAGSEGKLYVKTVITLATFLRAGLCAGGDGAPRPPDSRFPLRDTSHHMVQGASGCAYLNLFGRPRDEEGEAYDDGEERQRIFAKHFYKAVQKGADAAKAEGGEAGRAGAMLRKVLAEGMAETDE